MRAGKWVTIGLFMLGFGWLLWPVELREVKANSSGPQGSRTGAPAVGGFIAEPTCMTGCHTGNTLNSSVGSMTITGLPNFYFPGQEVTGTVTINHPNRSRFGFQLTALNETGGRAGTLDAVDRTRTQVINGLSSFGNRRYIQHTFSGIDFSPGSPGTWNFIWRAPETASGPINFYASGNAADRNGSSSGDFIYTVSKRLEPLPFGAVSAASFGPSNTLASEMIGSIFSVGLAPGVLTATPGQPLPTQLGGTSVEVQDSTGQVTTAPLFFVADSHESAPLTLKGLKANLSKSIFLVRRIPRAGRPPCGYVGKIPSSRLEPSPSSGSLRDSSRRMGTVKELLPPRSCGPRGVKYATRRSSDSTARHRALRQSRSIWGVSRINSSWFSTARGSAG